MPMRYRYLPHMADVAFVAYGSTFKKAIENAGMALLNVMFDLKRIQRTGKGVVFTNISASARSREDLVWKILQKVVSKLDENGEQAFSFRVLMLDEKEGSFKVKCRLKIRKTKKYMSLLEVKAVTPHGLEVKKDRGIWRVRVLIDV